MSIRDILHQLREYNNPEYQNIVLKEKDVVKIHLEVDGSSEKFWVVLKNDFCSEEQVLCGYVNSNLLTVDIPFGSEIYFERKHIIELKKYKDIDKRLITFFKKCPAIYDLRKYVNKMYPDDDVKSKKLFMELFNSVNRGIKNSNDDVRKSLFESKDVIYNDQHLLKILQELNIQFNSYK